MPSPRVFLGNVSYSTDEQSIRTHFADYTVRSVKIVTDRETGRPRGFVFVELGDMDEVRRAIEALDGSDLDGRTLKVAEARERETERRGR